MESPSGLRIAREFYSTEIHLTQTVINRNSFGNSRIESSIESRSVMFFLLPDPRVFPDGGSFRDLVQSQRSSVPAGPATSPRSWPPVHLLPSRRATAMSN